MCGSACHKGLSPDTPRPVLDVLPASGSHTSPTLSPAFVAPASSASSSSCNANLTCRPVHELVAMIYNERKRTAAVEGELWILRQELTRVQHQKLKSDNEVIMAKEDARRAADDATRLRAAAEADTTALQQELKVFHAVENRLKSLNLDHYRDGVLERIAQAVCKGNLDRTMDAQMLVSLAHNANLDASSKQRRFGNQLMRFWTYVFGQNSGAGAHRAATARHSDAIPGERPVQGMS